MSVNWVSRVENSASVGLDMEVALRVLGALGLVITIADDDETAPLNVVELVSGSEW